MVGRLFIKRKKKSNEGLGRSATQLRRRQRWWRGRLSHRIIWWSSFSRVPLRLHRRLRCPQVFWHSPARKKKKSTQNTLTYLDPSIFIYRTSERTRVWERRGAEWGRWEEYLLLALVCTGAAVVVGCQRGATNKRTGWLKSFHFLAVQTRRDQQPSEQLPFFLSFFLSIFHSPFTRYQFYWLNFC